MIEVIKIIGGIALDWFKSKREKAQAKHQKELQIIANTQTWEQSAQDNAGASWKDEYWTVILSYPFVASFIPPLVPYVEAGFRALESVPDWYKAFAAASIGASFGYKALVNKWGKSK